MVTLNLKPRFLCVVRFFVATHFLLRENYERRKHTMPDYEKMYFTLFNKVSDIIEELKQIQCEMEEIAIEDSKN